MKHEEYKARRSEKEKREKDTYGSNKIINAGQLVYWRTTAKIYDTEGAEGTQNNDSQKSVNIRITVTKTCTEYSRY